MAEKLGYDDVEVEDKNRPLMEENRPGDVARCFVCDMPVLGRYFSLASCRAQGSNVRLIEKLGTLVGDQYMVVISEDDVICHDCASNMNTLDRLELEALSVRSVVLKYLEKKYVLADGELVNQKNTGLGQPPRIMPSPNPPQNKEKKRTSALGNFMARKRRVVLAEMALENSAEWTANGADGEKASKSQWMQCRTCKYTTTYDSFKRRHLAPTNPTSVVGGNILQDKNGINDILDNGPGTSKKKGRKIAQQPNGMASTFMKETHFVDQMSQDSSHSNGKNIIGTDLATFAVDNNFNANVDSEDPETIKVQIVSQGQWKNCIDENDVTIELSDIPDNATLESTQMLTVEVGDVCVLEGADEDVLKMAGAAGNTVYVQMIRKDKDVAEVDTLPKQLLTVNADGTVEMVEVLWGENVMRQNAKEDGEQSPFQ